VDFHNIQPVPAVNPPSLAKAAPETELNRLPKMTIKESAMFAAALLLLVGRGGFLSWSFPNRASFMTW
jgi:hypothetical protein